MKKKNYKLNNNYVIIALITTNLLTNISCSSGDNSINVGVISNISDNGTINDNQLNKKEEILKKGITINVGDDLSNISIVVDPDVFSGEVSYDINNKILLISITIIKYIEESNFEILINTSDIDLIEPNSKITIYQKYDQYHIIKENSNHLNKNYASSIVDGRSYKCPKLSYIPVIAQEYLKKLPLELNHCLGKDIELKGDFIPIGNPELVIKGDSMTNFHENSFNAVFDGNKKKITGLSINLKSENSIGLFGFLGKNGEIKHLTIKNPNVIGSNNVGSLVGKNKGKIEGITILGGNFTQLTKVSGIDSVGGLVGKNYGIIIHSRVISINENFKVEGQKNVGGLVGLTINENSTGLDIKIEKSYSTIKVEAKNTIGNQNIGGFVGNSINTEISNSYSNGSVIGNADQSGSFLGILNEGNIKNCYSKGKSEVLGEYVSGFIGYNNNGTNVNNFFDIESTNKSNELGIGTNNNISGIIKKNITNNGRLPFNYGIYEGDEAYWDFNTIWSAQGDGKWPILKWQDEADSTTTL